MYTWKMETKPPAPFDGQVHVDNNEKIYRYSMSDREWLPYHGARMVLVDQFLIHSKNQLTTRQLEWLCKDHVTMQIWASAYSKCFFEFIPHDGSGEISHYYFAHYTWAQLETLVTTFIPNFGGLYTANAYVRVYDVIDPSITCAHFSAFNNLYGSMRGQDSYRYNVGAGREQYDVDSGFTAYWNGVSDLANNLLQQAFSIVIPAANDNRAIWFSAGRRGPYHFPKVGTTICEPAGNRWAYNTVSTSYESTTGLSWNYSNPLFIYRDQGESTNNLSIAGGAATFRGNSFIANRRSVIAIFPVSSGNYRALVAKPYGVTHIIIDQFDTSTYALYAETQFSGYSHCRHRSLESYMQYWGDNAMKIFIHNCFVYPALSPKLGTDCSKTPTNVRLYMKNKRTGVRSEYLNGKIDLVRRRPFMSQGFLHTKETHRGI